MRYFFHHTLVALFAITLVSCSSGSVPQKLDSFVDKAELNSADYSTEDWEKSGIQYEQLVNDYLNSENDYTEAEKEMAAKAIGRYHALLIKNGVEKSASFIKEVGKVLPSYIDGITEGLKNNSASIDSSLNNFLNDEKIEQSLNKLEEALESIMDNVDEK